MNAIFKKELRTYFTTMTGYIFLGFLVFITALYFGIYNVKGHSPDYTFVLSGSVIMFLIIIPALTMRLFAEESRQKTDQLLFTAPISIRDVVLGKYLAALSLFLFGMGITLLFPLTISFFGEINVSELAGSYLGYILLGACFIAVGLFISVLTQNQIIAAVGTFGALFVFFILNGLISVLPADRNSSIVFVALCILGLGYFLFDATKNPYAGILIGMLGLTVSAVAYLWNRDIFDGVIIKVMTWFSLLSRFYSFNTGILNFADILYYVTFAIAFLYLTVHMLEKRRWS